MITVGVILRACSDVWSMKTFPHKNNMNNIVKITEGDIVLVLNVDKSGPLPVIDVLHPRHGLVSVGGGWWCASFDVVKEEEE